MQGACPSAFPMEKNARFNFDEESPPVDSSRYKRLIRHLLHLTVIRPDIHFVTNMLSQFINSPRQTHMDAINRGLRYLKATPGQGIFLPSNGDLNLEAYCDSDWGGCQNDEKIEHGLLYFIWRITYLMRNSRLYQDPRPRRKVSEILWLRWLLQDLQATQSTSTPLYCDNQAARLITNNAVFYEHT